MFEGIFIVSSWTTAALLVALSWFIYKYSKNFVVEVNYWIYIYTGALFFAASEIARPLYLFNNIYLAYYFIFSVFGALLLAYGFYRLYKEGRI